MTKTWNETLYDAWGQRHDIDKVYFEFDTGHQQLMIFHNALFGRVMVLDGVVQTTEKDEFIYHEMLTHVPILAHGKAKRVLIIGGGGGGGFVADADGQVLQTRTSRRHLWFCHARQRG